MAEERSNEHYCYPSIRERIEKFNRLGKVNDEFPSIPIHFQKQAHSLSSISSTSRSTVSEYVVDSSDTEQQTNPSNQTITATDDLQSDIDQTRSITPTESHLNNEGTESALIYSSSAVLCKEHQVSTNRISDDIGLEVIEAHDDRQRSTSIIDHYGENDIQQQSKELHPSVLLPPPLPPLIMALPHLQEEPVNQSKRTFQLSNFLLEAAALLVVFILCMVLVLAIRENQANLRTTMQIVYTYIYLISIVWMLWCTFDIIKFRRQWMKLTSTAHNQEEYMDVVERYPHSISYFPDIHNTSGLFMRIGAGLLCMGSLLLTLIELAKTVETIRTIPIHREVLLTTYSKPVLVAKSITFICRFFFHCVQFTFLFRYGNIIIDRYHFIAKLGLIHIVIANFCTWFEAIVIETLEQLHKPTSRTITADASLTFPPTKTVNFDSGIVTK